MTEEVMKTISLEVVREKMLHHIHQVIPFISVVEFGTLISVDFFQMEFICLWVSFCRKSPMSLSIV
jgi:hypothetical protein